MIKNLKDNKNCSQDEQPSRFYFVTKNYSLKDKACKFLVECDVFTLNFCVFILKRQRGRIHCLYSRSSLCLKNDCIFIISKYQIITLNEYESKATFIKNVHVFK